MAGGRFAEAFDDVSAVIELNPGFAKAYSNRATLYVQAGKHELAVACGHGVLELLVVQPAGKKQLAADDFLRGYSVTDGDRFE